MFNDEVIEQRQKRVTHNRTGNDPASRKHRLLTIKVGIAAGKSNRQIAKALNIDEGTVRNVKKILALPSSAIQAFLCGAPALPLLRAHRERRGAIERYKQEIAERESQHLTNRLLTAMEAWLNQFPLLPVDKRHILDTVDRRSWYYGSRTPVFIPDSKINKTIESTKPQPGRPAEVFALIEWLNVWLFRWIVAVEQDCDIRDRALTKLRQKTEGQYRGW